MSGELDQVARVLLERVAPSALAVTHSANPALDAQLDRFDAAARALDLHRQPSIASRLEDDLARAAPALEAAAVPLEAWAVPLLSALAGPWAPFLSLGMLLACKLALLAFDAWAKRRLAAEGASPGSPTTPRP